MRRFFVHARVIKMALPALLIIAMFMGAMLPSIAQAAPAGKEYKPSVEQMRGRTNYRGNPWAVAQPSCSSNRYYSQYPQRRYQPRTSVNWQNRNDHNRYDNRYDNDRYDRGHSDRCEGFTYQVRRGDTLTGIARRYGVSTQQLTRENHLRSPNHIYAGQRLHIPSSGYCR
jgi:nucleoid-associated protein YgaU